MKSKVLVMSCLAALLVLSGLARAADVPQPKKKNVLFIAVDDLNCRLGCYGDPIAKTPNLDGLAKRGVMFKEAYCQYPLCNPSRVSILTGMRPDTTRVWDLQTNFRSTVPDAVTLPQLFKQNGYYVARVGKIFHYGVPREIGTDGMDDPISWTYKFNPIGKDRTDEGWIHLLTTGGYKHTIGFAMAWLDIGGTDEQETDGIGVTETIRLLQEHKDKPFFIAMGFFRPHTPWIAPKKYYKLYPEDEIKLPARDAASDKALVPISLNIHPADYGLSEKDLKDCVRGYYACISFVDAQVGRLLDELHRLKLDDNTLIVFWSDHGFLLGEHGQWQKQLLFDPSPRAPLIIYDPSAKGNGTVCPSTVEMLDIYPTVANWAGLGDKKPKNLEGRSLQPLLDNPTADWDHPAYSQVTRRHHKRRVMGYSVHTPQYRYTEWGAGGKFGIELYDHNTDPGELHNLASDPAKKETVKKLRDLLHKVTPNRDAQRDFKGDFDDPQG